MRLGFKRQRVVSPFDFGIGTCVSPYDEGVRLRYDWIRVAVGGVFFLGVWSCAPSTSVKTTSIEVPKADEAGSVEGSIPPVPNGSPAPDFTVMTFDGKPTKLSSMRGHPVLIDYWATWCPPCLEGLPHTQKIFQEGSTKGLKVMTICDQDLGKVKSLIKEKKYTFPTFVDSTHEMGLKYHIDVIPVTIVIDAKGDLVDYIVGGGQDQEIKEALGKAGVHLG
jgi:peroxiredoxin